MGELDNENCCLALIHEHKIKPLLTCLSWKHCGLCCFWAATVRVTRQDWSLSSLSVSMMMQSQDYVTPGMVALIKLSITVVKHMLEGFFVTTKGCFCLEEYPAMRLRVTTGKIEKGYSSHATATKLTG